MIQYDLPEASTVKLSVFNILGQLVATLVNGHVEAGYQAVEWNTDNSGGKSLASGMYIYRIDATSSTTGKSFSQVRKMLLMK
jgi:flagellar hook assembly protein FlgD